MPISNFPRLRFTDTQEAEVLDKSGGFANHADPVGAEGDVNTHTSMVSMTGVKQLDMFIDISTNPGGAKLYAKVRFSGKETPDVATLRDWGYIQVDNVDTASGISSVKEYMVELDLANVNSTASAAPRRYLVRIDQISGSWASAVVWADVGGVEGKVYFQRQGGGM
tara:strand:- start:24 stop:521 length:498 start_codon:yes stop_codon:yes gene_type:complete